MEAACGCVLEAAGDTGCCEELVEDGDEADCSQGDGEDILMVVEVEEEDWG